MNLRAFNLLLKHRRIDEKLRAELARPAADRAQIIQLKKLKLAVKDRLVQLSLRQQTQSA